MNTYHIMQLEIESLRRQLDAWRTVAIAAIVIMTLSILMVAFIVPTNVHNERELQEYYERYGELN